MHNLHKALGLIFIAFLVFACGKETPANFTLNGKIKGLKKGVVYLQKEGDSSLITLDSLAINGQPEFTLQTNIEEPIVLYLKLFKNDGQEHFVPFFAAKGITEINSSLNNLNFNAEIKGSEQHKLLENYLKIMSQFNNQNLDLIEATFLAQKAKDSILVDSLNKRSATLLKRKYSYTIQYALNNNDSEVAPYLTLYEIPNANPVFIDSIYNGLTERIKASLYGKKLQEIIASRNAED